MLRRQSQGKISAVPCQSLREAYTDHHPRTITLLVALTSLAVYGGIIPAMKVIYFAPWIFTIKTFPPQLWRLLTSFWLTGPKLSIIFDPYFLFIYGSQLEKESSRFPTTSDFIVYVTFIHVAIIVSFTFNHALSLPNPTPKTSK